jgi:hypothetical protein
MPVPTSIDLVLASAMIDANQGVARDATHFFTSAGPGPTSTQYDLNVWNVDVDEMPDTATGVIDTRNCGSDAPGGIQQINGIYYHAADGHLYITCNNYPSTGASWVLEYDPANLAAGPVSTHALTGLSAEGVTWSSVTNTWWVFYHQSPRIEEYSTSWALIDRITLPMIPEGTSMWNGGFWDGDILYLIPHNENTDDNVFVFRYNGTTWPRFTILNKVPVPISTVGQGMFYYGTTLYMIDRNTATLDGRVLKCTITTTPGDEPLIATPTGALLFNDDDTTCGNTTATGLIGTKHSFVFWLKARGAFTASTARLIVLGDTDTQFRIYWEPGVGKIWVNRFWDGGAGLWSIPEPSRDDTTWLGFGITYDGTSTANDPLVWMRRLGLDAGVVAQTVSETSAPSGTITALGNGYQVGNKIGGGRCFNGPICHVQVWQGTILTEAQINTALASPGTLIGEALYLRLQSDGSDLSGNNYTATIDDGSFVSAPPGIPAVYTRWGLEDGTGAWALEV